MPVASKTRPLNFAPSSAVALTWSVLAMPRTSRMPGSDSASRPGPPTTTVPSTSGSPAAYRSSFVGCGRPRLAARNLPIAEEVKAWYLSLMVSLQLSV